MELADVRCLAVLGLRRSGRPAALLARRELPAARVVALDEGAPPSDDTVAVLEAAGVEVLTGPAALLPDEADALVKSPGVPDTSAAVQEALRRGVPLWSEVEFACRFLPNPVVGITGTNGKTTTTELTGAVFREAGLPVAVGGNVGHALAAMPGVVAADATVVAELSSFQLEHIERFRPAVAVLLNLTEDHLDRHGTYRAYVDAKLRIFEMQTPGDVALLCADDPGILDELAAGRLGGAARRGWSRPSPAGPPDPAAKGWWPAWATMTCSGCGSAGSSGVCAAATSSRCAATTICSTHSRRQQPPAPPALPSRPPPRRCAPSRECRIGSRWAT